ncbi:MAG: RagB/SusD family nutrient uptake outer membrane protein [Bacteroidales bacterium]|nr:RagB/SusD family nutrient uptake outer membrane protein [Bacteroidales bacterium]
MKNILKAFVAGAMVLSAVSCADFLNRPSEDSYTLANYYQTDEQCIQGVNYLYCSPWYDCIRFYIYGSETMCGNVYQGQNAYTTLTVNGTDTDLKNLSYSLWAVNAHCNTVINNILGSEGPSQSVKNQCIGECLTWKAMAYFLLVRTFGDVPIIHDNTEIIKESTYNEVSKVQKADVYDYIVLTLEKALELLPKNPYIGQYNRIDYYAAEALLSKVYLTKAGVSGSLSSGDLAAAKNYAEDVIKNSGRSLTPKYSDVFRLSPAVYQQTGEALISWLWTSTSGIWTCQNSIQSDVGCTGFDEFGDLWGDWKGPSVDLQDDFGVSAADNPMNRVNTDDRRKATIMMFGDKYEYFWQDKGGFDFYRFFYDSDYAPGTSGGWQCSSGANYAKHLYGNGSDHVKELGVSAENMTNQLPTHILRLSDIYLVYAEAAFLTGDKDTALEYVNKVRERANAVPLESVTFDDIWKERRLELALEGDRWYDYVRRSYYDMDACINELLNQRRSYWDGLGAAYKDFVQDDEGKYAGPGAHTWDGSNIVYNPVQDLKSVTPSMFTLPFPTEDVVLNPKVASDAEAIHVDVRETYSYNF